MTTTKRLKRSFNATGQIIDDAMTAIKGDNPSLKGVLSKDYARPTLNKQRLGELIDLVGTIGLGDAQSRSKDILGRVYEYFLGRFAAAEGKHGGQFYTARCIVQLLVDMIELYSCMIPIGDFGQGSDAPILLDYSEGKVNPSRYKRDTTVGCSYYKGMVEQKFFNSQATSRVFVRIAHG